MRKLLITGGTVFVSQYIAKYFVAKGDQVTVLNRNTRPQVPGVRLIQADRHDLNGYLSEEIFDVVIDVTAYDARDIEDLYVHLRYEGPYILISSSAVYPETGIQPFVEEAPLGMNRYWKTYGTDKMAAEQALLARDPQAYILRPPYLYGPGNNVYREAFVFDCALQERPFYLPGDGSMPLQFFYIEDLCRLIERILDMRPAKHIYNTGNPEPISVLDWVALCYDIAGKKLSLINVDLAIEQRAYFSFYPYAYQLDVSRQSQLLSDLTPLKEGLKQSFDWYLQHPDEVQKKPFMHFIDENLCL